jgi:hypothetical protein
MLHSLLVYVLHVGGGYSYRLCPANSDLSEECFQSHSLFYAKNTSNVLDENGKLLATVPAMRTIENTFPEGSEWTKNPFPQEIELRDPKIWPFEDSVGRGPFWVTVADEVEVPANLAAGHYVLSWRWVSDSEL